MVVVKPVQKSKKRYKVNKGNKIRNLVPKRFNNKFKNLGKVTEVDGISLVNTIKTVTTKVHRVLPYWIRQPENIKSDVLKYRKKLCCFSHVLDSVIMNTLHQNEIEYLFPVQCSVIKSILAEAHGMEFRYRPRDICVAAPTGSGKTLTYILPIIQVLSKRNIIDIRALIILPVTELAGQVAKEFKKYVEPYGLIVGSVYGSESISAEKELMLEKTIDGFKGKVDILVCTPGRLAVHLSQTPGLDFSKLRFIVLDEADHLLTGDWSDTLSGILKCISSHQKCSTNVLPPNLLPLNILSPYFSIPKDKFSSINESTSNGPSYEYPQAPAQKLLFSATLSHNPQQLRVAELHNPLLFATSGHKHKAEPIITEGQTGQFVRPPNLTEEYIRTETESKALCLFRILLKEKQSEEFRALVFANTVEVVHRLSILLKFMADGYFKVESFSSAVKNRRSVLKDFLVGNINVLISTDAMARGIDVENINCVISYELVGSSTYTHRAGRTARAGRPGKSISIVTSNEIPLFRKTLGKSYSNATDIILPGDDTKEYAEKYKLALHHLSANLKKEIKTGRSSQFTNFKQNNKSLRKFLS